MSQLKITTFNIRCFGFDGQYYAPQKSESRIPFLKDFIQKNFFDTDVFILQEVMDLNILNQILPDGFKLIITITTTPDICMLYCAVKNIFHLRKSLPFQGRPLIQQNHAQLFMVNF